MGTESFRLFLIIIVLFYSVLADYSYHYHLNANRRRIILSSLFTDSHYPSIDFALEQVNSQLLFETNQEFYLNETEGIIHVNSSNYENEIYVRKFLF
jgi:hypothetical protein